MNAKQEFLNNAQEQPEVICASIMCNGKHYNLKVGYTSEEFNAFVESLDFKYDSGYGGQELFGTIWCKNGVWLSRGEYDGSEWWEANSYPEILEELK